MKARLMIWPVVLLAVALLAGGCGGDDEGGGGSDGGGGASAGGSGSGSASEGGSDLEAPTITTSSLSKAQFVKQANAACRREREDILDEISAYTKENEPDSGDPKEFIAGMIDAVVVPTIEAEIVAVADLGAPAGDEQRIEAILAEQADVVAKVAEQEKLESIEAYERYFTDVDKRIRAYGFADCTNSPDPNFSISGGGSGGSE